MLHVCVIESELLCSYSMCKRGRQLPTKRRGVGKSRLRSTPSGGMVQPPHGAAERRAPTLQHSDQA